MRGRRREGLMLEGWFGGVVDGDERDLVGLRKYAKCRFVPRLWVLSVARPIIIHMMSAVGRAAPLKRHSRVHLAGASASAFRPPDAFSAPARLQPPGAWPNPKKRGPT